VLQRRTRARNHNRCDPNLSKFWQSLPTGSGAAPSLKIGFVPSLKEVCGLCALYQVRHKDEALLRISQIGCREHLGANTIECLNDRRTRCFLEGKALVDDLF